MRMTNFILIFILGPFILFALSSSLPAKTISGFDLVSNKSIEKNITSKAQVYIFLSSQCPCSQSHFDHLNELQKTFPQFSFVGFQVGKGIDANTANAYYQKYKIDFPIVHDVDFKYADSFKAVKTPHIFIYSDEDKLLYQGGATDSRHPGRARKFYLKDALTSLAANEKIIETEAKTLGCYIQR